MDPVESISRREFLRWTGLAGGGLILAAGCRGTAPHRPGDPFVPGVFLEISPEGGVTVVVSRTEMGQGSRTGLAMIAAEELDVDWASVVVRQADAAADERYGSQMTGGSLSIRELWEPLRRAGAVARELLVEAAARSFGVDPAGCRTERGAVVHDASGRRAPYRELVDAAAALPSPDPERVPLKDPADYRLVGTSVPRIDAPAIVDGSATYGSDTRVPGQRYAAVARCPYYGGRLRSLDAAAAKAIPGVGAVVTLDAIEKPFPHAAGVAVVADDTWTAMRGARALRVAWDPGPNLDASTDALRVRFRELAGRRGDVVRDDGDVEPALAAAAHVVEAVYELPFLAHTPMEPMNCVVHVERGRCTVWSPTQNPQYVQAVVADELGLRPRDVTVHVALTGGAFGRRLAADVELEAAKVAREVEGPVQVVWTREDDVRHDRYRPSSHHVLRGGIGPDGLPKAWSWHILNTFERRFVPDDFPALAVPDYRVEYTHVPWILPRGAWRATVNSQNPFVVQAFLDELIAAGDLDPVEARLDLLRRARERAPAGFSVDHARLAHVLETVAKRAGWAGPRDGERGRGVAFHSGYGAYTAQIADVVVRDGAVRVERVFCAVDCGRVINPDLATAQIEGAIAYGLSAALKQRITVSGGRVEQGNFDDFPTLAIHEMPEIVAVLVPSEAPPGGLGEPPLPPIAPAVANAVCAATGKRLRTLPFDLAAA